MHYGKTAWRFVQAAAARWTYLNMDEKAQLVEVVAAVIERDGMVLICQRKDRGKHALKWEFPGGKVEPGEGYRAALVRELTEELGIDAVIGDEIERYDFQ
jgi:mutator protein MutT